MTKVLIVEPPRNCWVNGYPIHHGDKKESLNKTTVYANKHKLLPNQQRLRRSFSTLKDTLISTGITPVVLEFPRELEEGQNQSHDAVFIRDSGLMFRNLWIKANFSVQCRQVESETYATIIQRKFDKEIVSLPKEAFIEFGEVIYVEVENGTFYFGGMSRANKKGHQFVKDIIKPEYGVLIKSEGYHLDTVLTPLISANNELAAVVVAEEMIDKVSMSALKRLGIEIIVADKTDSSDDDGLGTYAINCLATKGILIGGAEFRTPDLEHKIRKLGIRHCIVQLPDFNFAGGSVHCLTNEIPSGN